MSDKEKVGIAEYKVVESPKELITLGLGSCVGIAIYSPATKIGGLSHIMLPDSREFNRDIQVAKFANLAIPAMVDEIRSLSKSERFVAKIAGGASMFNFDSDGRETIGDKNIKSVEKTLRELNIPILGRDLGGNSGRTMVLNLENLEVSVRLAMGEYKIL